MLRAILCDCLPWLGLLLAAGGAIFLLLRVQKARPNFRRIAALHADETGAVQSLSFVLTLPIFVLLMLFIIQVSQIMIGTVVVHYAAYAAARAAIVWIPARVGNGELENCIGPGYVLDPFAPDQVMPITDPTSSEYGPTSGGLTFIIPYDPASLKYQKIVDAAVLAVMPICPSRDLGLTVSGSAGTAANLLRHAYLGNVPGASAIPRVPRRLENKLAYALNATELQLRFFHSNSEPPLTQYLIEDDVFEFRPNELGFQDTVTVTVTHHMALLPGPGRFLARPVRRQDGLPDRVAERIERYNGIARYPLTASISLGIEGEKSVLPYTYSIFAFY
ncbi:MAG: TadE/TadG family type IV pilus assembly protein [Thermogutta sp.]